MREATTKVVTSRVEPKDIYVHIENDVSYRDLICDDSRNNDKNERISGDN